MIKKADVRNLAKSFQYAFRGIVYCVKNERNMRIHLSMVVLISYFAWFFRLERLEYIMMLLCFGFVIAAEAVNTAVEAMVNLESPSYHPYARIAKDVAAGAVLVSAATAGIVGVILFFDLDRLFHTLLLIFSNPVSGCVMLALIFLSVLFVFGGHRFVGKKNRNTASDQMRKNYRDKA